MRYEKGHKENTRQHLLEVASREFRKDGIEAVGIAGLMKSAGLTNGAFYAHFESKEDLVREVLNSTFESQLAAFERAFENGVSLEEVIRDYLSPERRDHCDNACIAAALTAEVARHPRATRKIFSTHVEALISLLAKHIASKSPKEKRSRGIAIYAQLIGSLQLARVVSEAETSDLILESGIQAALQLAKLGD